MTTTTTTQFDLRRIDPGRGLSQKGHDLKETNQDGALQGKPIIDQTTHERFVLIVLYLVGQVGR